MPSSTPASATADLLLGRADPDPRWAWRRPRICRRLLRNRGGMLGVGITVVASLTAVFGEHLAPHTPALLDVPPMRSPSLDYPMGTDVLGRDMLSAVMLGARTAMTVVAGVGLSTAVLGILLGSIAATRGGWVDDVIIRIAELIQSVPRFFLAIMVAGYFGGDLKVLIVLLSLTSWPLLARVVRAESLSIVQREYVAAARSFGASPRRVLARHVIPNVLPVALVVVVVTASRVVLLEASLSFLGLGDPEVTSWGSLLNNAQSFLETAWWMAVFPGLAIVVTVLGLNLVGDALADLLNPIPVPRHRRGRGTPLRRYGFGTVAAEGRSERGSTLVGLVMALVVLGGLTALVVPTLGGGPDHGGAGVGGGLAPTPPGVSPAGGRGPAAVRAASVAACRADVAGLEASMVAAHALTGSYPTSFAELAAKGFINEIPARPGFTFAPEMTAGSPTGRVTVNGRPAADGCTAPEAPAGETLKRLFLP